MQLRDISGPGNLIGIGVILGAGLGMMLPPFLMRGWGDEWIGVAGSIAGGLVGGITTLLAALIAWRGLERQIELQRLQIQFEMMRARRTELDRHIPIAARVGEIIELVAPAVKQSKSEAEMAEGMAKAFARVGKNIKPGNFAGLREAFFALIGYDDDVEYAPDDPRLKAVIHFTGLFDTIGAFRTPSSDVFIELIFASRKHEFIKYQKDAAAILERLHDEYDQVSIVYRRALDALVGAS